VFNKWIFLLDVDPIITGVVLSMSFFGRRRRVVENTGKSDWCAVRHSINYLPLGNPKVYFLIVFLNSD